MAQIFLPWFLPQKINCKLKALIRETGRSKSDILLEALSNYFEDMEDATFAERVLERINKGEEQTYSLDEVEKELDLAP